MSIEIKTYIKECRSKPRASIELNSDDLSLYAYEKNIKECKKEIIEKINKTVKELLAVKEIIKNDKMDFKKDVCECITNDFFKCNGCF